MEEGKFGLTRHELVERLQRIGERQSVGEADHDARIGALVHFGGEEEGVTPQTLRHSPFERLLLVAEQQQLAEIVRHRHLRVARDQRPVGRHVMIRCFARFL